MNKPTRVPTPVSKEYRPQFSLRTLLCWMAGLCVLFAVLAQLPLVWALTAVWFLLLIAAHVVGNALGTRLRDVGAVGPDGDAEPPPPAQPTRKLQPQPEASKLHQRTPLGRVMFAVAALGACLGGSLGGNAAAFATGDSMTFSGLAVATISSGVMGALFGFLAASFLSVLTTSILQGMRAENC